MSVHVTSCVSDGRVVRTNDSHVAKLVQGDLLYYSCTVSGILHIDTMSVV